VPLGLLGELTAVAAIAGLAAPQTRRWTAGDASTR